MAVQIDRYTYSTIRLPDWAFETPVAQEGRLQFLPIRHFCKWLGIDSATQIMALKDRYKGDELREIPYKSGAGWRMSIWLRRDKLGIWLLGIDPKRCKLRSSEKLEAFQSDIAKEADALLFGARPRDTAPKATYSQHDVLRITCLECGTPHEIVIVDGEVRVSRVLRGD